MTDWSEVRVPVPWGYVAAKARGSITEEPMICVHGDADNAASFDYLLPLLPQKYYFLSIDLPGHGKSSHYSPGISYKLIDYVFVLKRVVDYFKWSKVNVLGHHSGGLLGLYFASCFSEIVENVIVIDVILRNSNERFDLQLKSLSEYLFEAENQKHEKSDYKSLCERIQTWRPFPLSPRAERLLMERNLLMSQDSFALAIDPRVSHVYHLPKEKHHLVTFLKPIKCNLLLIMCKDVVRHKNAFPVKTLINSFRKNCNRVEYNLLNDVTDVHINRPEKVSDIINKFMGSLKSRSSL